MFWSDIYFGIVIIFQDIFLNMLIFGVEKNTVYNSWFYYKFWVFWKTFVIPRVSLLSIIIKVKQEFELILFTCRNLFITKRNNTIKNNIKNIYFWDFGYWSNSIEMLSFWRQSFNHSILHRGSYMLVLFPSWDSFVKQIDLLCTCGQQDRYMKRTKNRLVYKLFRDRSCHI